ncbi:prepilin peptidase [Amnibacterium kyonggiense]|uniref:Prepilin leader peptidase/N-methyltransferase n=1 Tax=Amnibacterium kyonggiense TaxID=595671 RepID=A0A4R7FQY8_9MICO|nr:A24 family peptidase [Amnibacterium kyonggiense]TDS80108.1 leader peptidase (prepilin peptidase)/N-methyltransferase [Amnibacterium kyonggiense]
MTTFILVTAGVLGLLIGSFLNVVAYRVPAGLSIVSPGSACPGCRNEISARDNIPLLSWVLLRGRCRHCDMRIPVRYPLVEGATGLAFVVAALPFAGSLEAPSDPRTTIASSLELVAFLYLAAISVVLAVIDLDTRRLPDSIVLPGFAVGAALLGGAGILRADFGALLTAGTGAVAAAAFFYVLYFIGGMGFGDVKLAGVVGLFLGFLGIPQLVVGFAAAFAVGAVFGIGLMVVRGRSRKTAIPFGPWILTGAWIGVLAGEPLATGYLRLMGLA